MKKLLFLFLLLLPFLNFSQESDTLVDERKVLMDSSQAMPLRFDESYFEKLKDDPDFSYIDHQTTESWWSRFKNWLNKQYQRLVNWLFGSYSPGSFLAFIIQLLPYLLIGILVALIIWLFTKLNPARNYSRNQGTPGVLLSDEEQLVKNEDLDQLIQRAVAEQHYRLAVRYYYLAQLRKLDDLKMIVYEFQKTNMEYAAEIEDELVKQQFLQNTRFYEFIWYGGFQVSEADFEVAQRSFQKMDQIIKNTAA